SWDMMDLQSGTNCPNSLGMSDSRPTSFRSVIERWSSREAMASDIGARASAVSKWWQRDCVPAEWWSRILATETARAAGVTADALTTLAARERADDGARR